MTAITRAVALAATTLVACSLTLQERVPEPLALGEYPRCSDSGETAVADLGLALGLGVISALFASTDEGDSPALGFGAGAAAFAGSSAAGFWWTSRCRCARSAWQSPALESPRNSRDNQGSHGRWRFEPDPWPLTPTSTAWKTPGASPRR